MSGDFFQLQNIYSSTFIKAPFTYGGRINAL